MDEKEELENQNQEIEEITDNPEVGGENKKKLKDKYKQIIASQDQEIKELKNKALRVQADTENFKKRLINEYEENKKYATSSLLSELIDPIDQLSKVVSMQTDNELLNNFLVGFKMIEGKIFDCLKANGVKKIETFQKKFDPRYHNAIEKTTNPELEENIIVKEISTGYMLKDRVLKPSLVVVNVKGENNE
ncbi:MAG: nucleotide exchange factor GrpE [Acholeplasmatales bacterium]|jgi:molecular chaperone GrpE|nr:nucleotide exchange factor GrpE [Acholeplasmatales bacterium]